MLHTLNTLTPQPVCLAYKFTVKPMMGEHSKASLHDGVPSSEVLFNIKVEFGSRNMPFRHPNICPLIIGLIACISTIHQMYLKIVSCS